MSGYYGMMNFGDDLFGQAVVSGADRWWPSVELRMLAPGRHAKATPAARNLPPEKYASMTLAGRALRAVALARALPRADTVVFAGGSLFTSDRSRLFKIMDVASPIHRRKFAGIGISVGPFGDDATARELGRFLKRFTTIVVRDARSFGLLRDIGIDNAVLGADLAGTLHVTLSERQDDIFGYVPCRFDSSGRAGRLVDEAFLSHSSKLKGRRVRIYSLNVHPSLGDLQQARHVASELKARGVEASMHCYVPGHPGRTWDHLGECAGLLTARLHGSLAAYLHETPFALLEHHAKCTDFVDDIGQDDSLRLKMEPGGAQALRGQMGDVIDSLIEGSARAPLTSVGEYQRRASRNFIDAPWATL